MAYNFNLRLINYNNLLMIYFILNYLHIKVVYLLLIMLKEILMLNLIFLKI